VTQRSLFLAGALALLLPACREQPAGGTPRPPAAPVIQSAQLVADGEGRLVGTNLDALPVSILVDGVSVNPSSRSATEVRFPMPRLRQCEVDGRRITVSAGQITYVAAITVATTLRLEAAESRELAADELTKTCLQLPASDQSFVLTVTNLSTTADGAADRMLALRTWTESGQAVAASRGMTAARTPPPLRHGSATYDITTGRDRYSDSPAAFDPAYANAQPGQTVRWVDFRSPAWYASSNICREPKSSVPTFGAVVAAVSTSGRTVIAFDERSPHLSQWSTSEMAARLKRLADILDRWTLPAVREVFGEYTPVRGAGGRWWHIFRTGISQPTVDQAGLPQTMCPHYSEVATTLAPDVPLTSDGQVEVLAGYLIHEYAHHAEDVVAVRRWGNVFGRGPSTWTGIGESWAQTVQETAARLASGQPTAARYDALTPGSGVPYADFYGTGYGERPDLSPWAGSRGPYDQGARLLMYLRERWGDAALGSSRERFYARAIALPEYDFASIARLAGLEPEVALDRWSLAEATDDLVDPAAVAARALPQIQTWVPQDKTPGPQVDRAGDRTLTLTVAHGSYAALYFFADQGHGLSLTFSDVSPAPSKVRITRLR
jgi:hypothetical protein